MPRTYIKKLSFFATFQCQNLTFLDNLGFILGFIFGMKNGILDEEKSQFWKILEDLRFTGSKTTNFFYQNYQNYQKLPKLISKSPKINPKSVGFQITTNIKKEAFFFGTFQSQNLNFLDNLGLILGFLAWKMGFWTCLKWGKITILKNPRGSTFYRLKNREFLYQNY